ncbi:MAG: Ig domain-containing protein [Muribaculaceae bacterium]|nr:Ig domain-containing protein [Muribaculaceae bacterium]
MKKISTLLAVALASTSMLMSAQSLSDTQTLWAKFVTNSGNQQAYTTQGNWMTLGENGCLYVVGQAGSTSSDQNILFGDEVVASGINYAGNSANQGLLMMRLDADGNVEWKLAQTNGEASNNEIRVAPTADGGAVVLANLRHTEGHLGENIVITDGVGTSHTIDWTVESERNFRGFVFKVSAQGAIEWMRELVMNTTADTETYPKWSQSSRNIGQGLKTYALDVDNEGNIYVGGIMCAAMTVDGVTIQPHNVATWNGSAQTTMGNLYIIKLDAEGNYVKHLITEGTATQENVQQLKVVGNKLYMFAWVAGMVGEQFSLGGEAVAPATNYGSICLAELDTDLNVSWLKFHESTVSGSAWQMPTLAVAGDKLYVMGTAKYGINIGDTNYTNTPANKARQSWLVQFSAANGDALNASVLATGNMQMQHGFFGAYEGTDGNIYAIERGLTPSTSFGSELILYKYNQETLSIDDQVQLADGSCDGQSMVTDGNRIYVMNRFANKNEVCTFYNSDITHTNAAFNWGQSAYLMPVGAVKSIEIDGDDAITLNVGESATVTATVVPAEAANSDIIWSSSDESVVTVAGGVITAVKGGAAAPQRARKASGASSAIVTATSASNPNVKKNIVVNVESVITAVSDLNVTNGVTDNNVYTIDGRLVNRNAGNLPAGIYIVGGKKVVVK